MIIEGIEAGTVFCYERTFTLEDVQQFSAISGDEGDHHTVPDEYGRVARDFTMKFVRPVFTGDTIRCEVTMHRIEKQEQRYQVSTTYVCMNQDGKEVLKGEVLGFVYS